MAKTQEELYAIKEEVEALNKKLAELTDEELAQVTGGGWPELKKFECTATCLWRENLSSCPQLQKSQYIDCRYIH